MKKSQRPFKLVIVGEGQLARAIAKRCLKEKVQYSFWEAGNNAKSVVLYCGSNRHSKEVYKFCAATKSPLVLLSSDVSFPKYLPFPFYSTPNASAEVREFIQTVVSFAQNAAYSRVSIIESHQSTKKDVSGTAQYIARSIGESPKIITSIRTAKEQLKLGVPKRYLKGHAYHKVTFTHDGLTTEFSVLVLGRETYAKGAIEVAKRVMNDTFDS